jgi:8-oxo-dGTP pyrophosphatase MutT (NUDIX family)
MSPENPIVRPAARVILIDNRDCILLFRAVMPGRPDRPFWITPGGGLHDGESWEEAAAREIWEETGLSECALGPCVWVRQHTFTLGGRSFDQRERYFLARVERHEVVTHHQEAFEAGFLKGHRWWTLDELRASPERLVPRDLASLVEPLIRGQIPAEPLVVGL